MNATFYEEPAAFRAAASEYLKEHLRETSVLATQANRPKLEDQPYWFATITDSDENRGRGDAYTADAAPPRLCPEAGPRSARRVAGRAGRAG